MELSKKDRMIISELMDDARVRLSDLGRRCGMSRQTALNRIKHLKGKGIIEKFTIKPNYGKLGLDFRAYMLVTAEPGRKQRDALTRFLRGKVQVSQIHHLFGRFDFFLEAVTKDREELTELLKEIHQFEGVKQTETFIVYETLKYEPEGPLKRVMKD